MKLFILTFVLFAGCFAQTANASLCSQAELNHGCVNQYYRTYPTTYGCACPQPRNTCVELYVNACTDAGGNYNVCLEKAIPYCR